MLANILAVCMSGLESRKESQGYFPTLHHVDHLSMSAMSAAPDAGFAVGDTKSLCWQMVKKRLHRRH